MSALGKDRRAARLLALEVLYQAEIREQLPREMLAQSEGAAWNVALGDDSGDAHPPPGADAVGYATALVGGVEEHAAAIDGLIDRYADRWALERMPIIDKNLLRLAVYELLWEPEVPPAVVINEAIELAKSLSTEGSGRFINGILGRVVEAREEDASEPPAQT